MTYATLALICTYVFCCVLDIITLCILVYNVRRCKGFATDEEEIIRCNKMLNAIAIAIFILIAIIVLAIVVTQLHS